MGVQVAERRAEGRSHGGATRCEGAGTQCGVEGEHSALRRRRRQKRALLRKASAVSRGATCGKNGNVAMTEASDGRPGSREARRGRARCHEAPRAGRTEMSKRLRREESRFSRAGALRFRSGQASSRTPYVSKRERRGWMRSRQSRASVPGPPRRYEACRTIRLRGAARRHFPSGPTRKGPRTPRTPAAPAWIRPPSEAWRAVRRTSRRDTTLAGSAGALVAAANGRRSICARTPAEALSAGSKPSASCRPAAPDFAGLDSNCIGAAGKSKGGGSDREPAMRRHSRMARAVRASASASIHRCSTWWSSFRRLAAWPSRSSSRLSSEAGEHFARYSRGGQGTSMKLPPCFSVFFARASVRGVRARRVTQC